MADGDEVTLTRKSYDHLLRTRDRALRAAEWEREHREGVERWARRECDEQRRLSDRLTRVVAAAAAQGVSIQAINAALDAPSAECICLPELAPAVAVNCRANQHNVPAQEASDG